MIKKEAANRTAASCALENFFYLLLLLRPAAALENFLLLRFSRASLKSLLTPWPTRETRSGLRSSEEDPSSPDAVDEDEAEAESRAAHTLFFRSRLRFRFFRLRAVSRSRRGCAPGSSSSKLSSSTSSSTVSSEVRHPSPRGSCRSSRLSAYRKSSTSSSSLDLLERASCSSS